MSHTVDFKDFDEEEDRIYKKNIEMIRASVNSGVKFDLACEFIAVEDKELKELIIDDALKVHVAEMHYGKGLSLLDVSKALGVSMERLLKANTEMMEEVIHTAAETPQKRPDGSEPLTH